MRTLTFKVRADQEGVVHLDIPTGKAGQEIEIVVVMQFLTEESVDEMGYPIGYFEETYGIFANDPIERASSDEEVPPGSLAELAQNARDANLASSGQVDTAARSREILHRKADEFPSA